MKSFKEFIIENELNEVLDSSFDVHDHEGIKNDINKHLEDKIYSGHTAVLSSDHMDKHKLKVLRLKNKNNEVEYHLMNFTGMLGELPKENQNTKALLHALKIIKDDSKFYIDKGSKIKLQSYSDDQHDVYKKLANHLIKKYPNKLVKDMGHQPRLDGKGESPTLMIESPQQEPPFWVECIKNYMENKSTYDIVRELDQ